VRARNRSIVLATATLCVAIGVPAGAQESPEEPAPPAIRAIAETAPTREDGAKGTALWLHPDDPERSLILGADDGAGLGIYALDGTELQYLEDGPMKYVDVRYGVQLGDEAVDIVAASGDEEPLVRLYKVDAETRQLSLLQELEVGVDANGICLYRSPYTLQTFVFVPGIDGDMEQWRLTPGDEGTFEASLARVIRIGSEPQSCIADDDLSNLYVAEADVALWRYGAEPESGSARALVDFTGPAHPGGHLAEDVDGLAVAAYADGAGYLLAGNESASTLNVYRRDGINEFVGAVQVAPSTDGSVDGVDEPGGVAVLPVPISDGLPAGVLVINDDANSEPDANTDYKVASWGDLLAALGEPTQASTLAVRRDPQSPAGAAYIASVTAAIETDPVEASADAADDPAIYVDPNDPERSVIVGTDKQGALVVYGLDGSVRQQLPVGDVNNVDLRSGIDINGTPRTVVAASNRTDNTIWLFALDEATGTLEVAHEAPVSVSVPVYGFCLYQQPETGALYAFVTSDGAGGIEQYAITPAADGLLSGELARSFSVSSQAEGCVADDENRTLYLSEEGVGIWRFTADPDGESEGELVDGIQPDGNLVADVEGIALALGPDQESGYLLASSQGESLFAVYERDGNDYVGKFQVVDGSGTEGAIDAVSGTDGIDVTTAMLPAPFEGGLFVAQDDLNREPFDNQNFKLVRWADIVEAMGLE
jgi:3-phytase